MYPPAHPLHIIQSTSYKGIRITCLVSVTEEKTLCPTMIPIRLAFSHIFFVRWLFFILFFGVRSLAPHKSPLIANISHIHRHTHTCNTSNPDEKTTYVLDNKSTKPRNLQKILYNSYWTREFNRNTTTRNAPWKCRKNDLQ